MSGLSCGAECVKIIIIIVNVIFGAIGLITLGCGAYFIAQLKFVNTYVGPVLDPSHQNIILAASFIILIVGIVLLLVTILGCCGACKEDPGCLTVYSSILIILLILQVVAVILAGVKGTQVKKVIEKELERVIKEDYGKVNSTTESIDAIQSGLQCCGVTKNGPLDWKTSYWHNHTQKESVPKSCCTTIGSKGPVKDLQQCRATAYDKKPNKEFIYTEGCYSLFEKVLTRLGVILIGVVIAIVIVQLVFIVLVCLLKSRISRGYESV